ncbi:unnamed protein product, partial [Effrenium voratum]
HFHYGRQSSVLAAAFGGKDIGALDAFGRVVAGCLAAKGRTNALDVGCATGGLSFDLSEHFDHVVGIDASMAFIRAASCLQSDGSLRYNSPGSGHVALARAKGRPSRCSFACADAADFMQQGLRFDLILACNVLCRLRRPRQWLASLPTSLSPQGVVVLPGKDAFCVFRWKGWQSLVNEREVGDQWLEEADARRKQLETFGTLRKSTEDSKGAELHVADQVHKFAYNAERRYRRALKWIEMDKKEDRKLQLEQATLRMRLAKAMSLRHMRFGENPEPATDDEKAALKESQDLLAEVLQVSEALNNASIRYECMKMNLQVCIQAENVTEARKVLTQLQEDRPDDEDLKSDNASCLSQIDGYGNGEGNEIKIRKKKNWLQHKGGEKQAEKVPDVQASQIVRSTLGLGPPPGLAASGPMWIAPGDSDLGEGARGPSYVGPGEVRRELQDFQDGQGLSGLMTRAGEIEFGRDYLQALFSDDAVTDGRVPWPPTPLPSRGSAKHSAGECRPCAWFWKKGCLNGELCQHCHLCPEGEIRRKKKAKNEGRDKYNIDMPLRPANSFDQGCSVWKLPDAAASSTIFDLPFGHGPGLRIDRPTFSIADAASAV